MDHQAQKRARIHKSRLEKGVEKAAEDLKNRKSSPPYNLCSQLCFGDLKLQFDIYFFCLSDDPNNDPNASGDPYKTLFVARLVSSTAC